MKKFRRSMSDDSDSIDRLNRDRMGAETVLNQRLILFLVVFAVIIISALNAQKKIFFLSLLFAGLVICWVLAYIVVTAARRVGYLVKQIHANDPDAKKIDRKGGGCSVRFLLGYFIPIFCSALLTVAFVTGAFGFMDTYLWPTSISTTAAENKVKEVGSEIKKQLEPPKEQSSGNFKNVDSVIQLSKPLPDDRKTMQAEQSTSAHVGNKTDKYSANFKSVDSIIALSNPVPAKRKINVQSNVSKKQTLSNKNAVTPDFKSIDSAIAKVKSTKLNKKVIEVKSDTAKTRPPKKEKPSPHFENIDSVITKPK